MALNNQDVVLATDTDGVDITVQQVKEWIEKHERSSLADFIYLRLHGRYIHPHSYSSDKYKSKYKNGFAIMASCCLLIETFTSFKEASFLDTNHQGSRCFKWFFSNHSAFTEFSEEGLAGDFYSNIRCGILHNAETRNGWKIKRAGPLFDSATKTINATNFIERIDHVLNDYRSELEAADWEGDLWSTYLARLEVVIENTTTAE